MPKETLVEIMEKNKKILRNEYEKGYLIGFQEGEKRATKDILKDLKTIEKYGDLELKRKMEKWEEREKSLKQK